jgi:urease accessory protein
MSIVMAEPLGLAADGLLRLMAWLSPSFPVGGFSYSHGIEYAVEAGLLTDRAAVDGWIGAILGYGSGWSDAVLFIAAHRAVAGAASADDAGQLAAVAELAAALRASAETSVEARAQGQAFLAAVRSAWPDSDFDAWLTVLGPTPAYAVAVAVAAATGCIDEASALVAFLHAVAAGLVSAAIRLVPLGQSDGQRCLAALLTGVPDIVERARRAGLDDLGTSTPMVDWTCMRHETQYSRLFRS